MPRTAFRGLRCPSEGKSKKCSILYRPQWTDRRNIGLHPWGQGKVIDMGPTRFQDEMHDAGESIEPARGICPSSSPRSRTPRGRPERPLSVDAVMDDMRAILWPDHRDQVSAEVRPVSKTRAQD